MFTKGGVLCDYMERVWERHDLASIMTNPDLLPYVSIKGLDEMNLEKYLIICAKL